MFALFVAVLFLGCSPVTEGKYSALRFGQTEGDYIEWTPVDMSSARTQFSVCTWLRKRHQARYPMVLNYYPGTNSYGMLLGADGYHNYVVGTMVDLRSEFNVPDGQWFHVCWMWSTSDYRLTVYLNGEQIGSVVTKQREVRTGGKMCLGDEASVKFPSRIFGGDLYKMNIYNRVLVQSEIRRMSSDMCSAEEERLTDNRIVKWEEILLKERAGSVTEISSGCHEEEPRTEPQQRPVVMVETESETEQELTKTKTLDDILRRLQNTEQELTEIKANFSQRLENVTISLTSTQVELDSTKQELAITITDLKISVEKLESATMSLNHTLEQLEAAKEDKDCTCSKWDALFSDKFINKKLTRKMSQKLKSTGISGNILDLFVGIKITEELITYLTRHHEEDMVCQNTGN